MDVSAGTQIGNYVVERLIGRGTLGPVYAARHVRLGKLVALRVLATDVSDRVRAASAFTHASAVRTLDVGEEHGIRYVALEYVEGRSLERVLQDRGRLSALETVLIGRQVGAALTVAHRKGVMHGTLKPSSVFITRDGTVRVADFGLADTDVVSDLRALGAIMYRALTGMTPSAKPRPALQVVTGVLPAVSDVVDRLLSDDPHSRFSSADAATRSIALLRIEDMPLPMPDTGAPDPDAMLSLSFGSLAILGDETMLDLSRPEPPPPPPVSPAVGPPTVAQPPTPRPRGPRIGLRAIALTFAALVAIGAIAIAIMRHAAWVREQERETSYLHWTGEARRAFGAGEWARALESCELAFKLRRDGTMEVIARESARRLTQDDVRSWLAAPRPAAFARLEGALGTLETIALDPAYADNPELPALAGEAWHALGDLPRAEARLTRAIALGASVGPLLARVCLERWIAAQLADRATTGPSALNQRAEDWRRRGTDAPQDDAARAWFASTPEERDKLLETSTALARLIRGALRSDLADLDQAIRLAPRHSVAHYLRGLTRESHGARDAALVDHSQALELDPSFIDARLARARLLPAPVALAETDAAVRLCPDCRSARIARGRARLAMGNGAGAAAEFAWVLARDPRDARTFMERGAARLTARSGADAIRDFDQAILLEPRAHEAWSGRAAARALVGDPRGAVTDGERALELAPDNWPGRSRVEQLIASERSKIK